MITETDLDLADGRTLHVYDTGEQDGTRLAVFWHHGTPNTGQVDDDLAYVAPWGFDPAQVTRSGLFLHGGQDRIAPSSQGEWLARRCPSAQLRLYSDDGHISILDSAATALAWLAEQAGRA